MIKSVISQIKYMFTQRSLINQFTRREISNRYKGSYLGILWSLITPLMMLVIYTFVFSVVFQAKWGTGEETSKVEFALLLLAGLLVFNIFSEVISKSPFLITSNPNYVKKVVFPLEIMPIVAVGSALFQAFISYLVLIVALFVLMGTFNFTALLFPIVILPLILFTLGLSWFLSSLGVYIKDVGQLIALVLPALMFMSPIFYPISVIPKEFHFVYLLNPITYVVEDARRTIIWGQFPHWDWVIIGTILGILFALSGYIWFKKTRKGFADVL
ncbi:sugar ABC transporter permease [Lysinibacillus contaminans]|uniref:Transport permease protein n=1 Tax=Lysinibacillus contaminans TaxID=1293441 RepID=A0ABR5JX46_9BACI|nr:ABC transporter permease [Lysinibacillus contaminans]KOS66603.1 sugar ABC transporter permease [Lysinibacillus contaminans]